MSPQTTLPRTAPPADPRSLREPGRLLGVVTRCGNGYGGSETQILQMIGRWRARGFRVRGVAGTSRWGGPPTDPGFRTIPGRAFRFPWGYTPLVLRHLAGADAVFLNGASLASLVWGPALRAAGIPVLAHVSGIGGYEAGSFGAFPWPLRGWLRSRARAMGIYRATTEHVRECLGSDGIPSDRIVLIPNGVDLERFRPLEGTDLGARRDAMGVGSHPLIVSVGRLAAEKGLEEALPFWMRVFREFPRAQWWILGDGPRAGPLRRAVRGMGLEGSVRFAGDVADVAPVLAAADLLVFPSHREGCPNAVLEAFACGVPVVARRIPALRPLIGRNERGFLLPDLSAEALGEAVLELLRRPDMRSRMGRAARAYVEANHDLETISDRVLESLVGASRGGAA